MRERERERERDLKGFWGGRRTPVRYHSLWTFTPLTLKVVLEFKGQSEQCQPCCPLSEKTLSKVTMLDGGGGEEGSGMLWDGLVKKNLTRTRSRTLQHRTEDKLEKERERVLQDQRESFTKGT